MKGFAPLHKIAVFCLDMGKIVNFGKDHSFW